jgi:hypothetical protein
VAFSALTDFGAIMALAIAVHNIPEVRFLPPSRPDSARAHAMCLVLHVFVHAGACVFLCDCVSVSVSVCMRAQSITAIISDGNV